MGEARADAAEAVAGETEVVDGGDVGHWIGIVTLGIAHEGGAFRPAAHEQCGQPVGCHPLPAGVAQPPRLPLHEAPERGHVLAEPAEDEEGPVVHPRVSAPTDRARLDRVVGPLAGVAEHELARPHQWLAGPAEPVGVDGAAGQKAVLGRVEAAACADGGDAIPEPEVLDLAVEAVALLLVDDGLAGAKVSDPFPDAGGVVGGDDQQGVRRLRRRSPDDPSGRVAGMVAVPGVAEVGRLAHSLAEPLVTDRGDIGA